MGDFLAAVVLIAGVGFIFLSVVFAILSAVLHIFSAPKRAGDRKKDEEASKIDKGLS